MEKDRPDEKVPLIEYRRVEPQPTIRVGAFDFGMGIFSLVSGGGLLLLCLALLIRTTFSGGQPVCVCVALLFFGGAGITCLYTGVRIIRRAKF